ncbi:hypothetical protein [Allorhodopirellula solitaria]|uniref:Biopolymer transport protein ExbD/TolR n=1 Tax=Allorhodopirellula solitaria TaxID=2527987 RepID=A0A5C5X0L2_9BACT|nr:hypothetical protein [Allorhodopirellula solitaria]TWT56139.1 hypothetical protein CA85_44810 [Allorhodopirellula solitaria]
MKKRGPIIVGAGIALLAASQFLDFGLGFQEGDGPGATSDPNAQVSMDPTITPSPSQSERESTRDEAAEDSIPSFAETPEPSPPDVVDILIDGSLYLVIVQAGEATREPMTLDQIVAMASTVDGEESGIRVRVARTPNAVASAEAAVMQQLSDAGLAADEIDARRQLVEAN